MELLELLIWTYRDQRAHRYLRREADWFRFMAAAAAEPDEPRPPVHADAALVHANVLELGEHAARLVIAHAANAEVPVRCDEPTTCGPTIADRCRDRYGRALYQGELIDYRLAVAERIPMAVPIFERRGRKRVRTGERVEIAEVVYCPVVIEPPPEWREAVNALHGTWRAAIGNLARVLAATRLTAHDVVDLDRYAEAIG